MSAERLFERYRETLTTALLPFLSPDNWPTHFRNSLRKSPALFFKAGFWLICTLISFLNALRFLCICRARCLFGFASGAETGAGCVVAAMTGADGVGATVAVLIVAPLFEKAVAGWVCDIPFAVVGAGTCMEGAASGVEAAGGLVAAGGCLCCCTGERGGTVFAASSLAFCASARAASSAARRFFCDSTSS